MKYFFLSQQDFIRNCDYALTILDYAQSIKRDYWYFNKCQLIYKDSLKVYNCYFYNIENNQILLLICKCSEDGQYKIIVEYLLGY